ncbi:PREDICTED: uncharacterized protein LOC109580365 [Amphimedon queenslandica]|uniref:Fibronectin type-III domain-containing protein n=1 Tax=Amphimedon queenslandica TaxID=400682 RepID=A0A1X7VGB0_AMPQE|nr:PREDICTED: uncharacterized protein LOC109580365 [Amphimedon queenslandica]|eukprot:XP_019848977.1 PREDICTED: uncharacterized protein LOC109580365 [Amphimedon queenslandica]
MEIIKGDVSMPNNLTAFTVIVSMSNMGGEFLPIPPFKYAKVGPVTDIKPSPENCDVLNITWVAPHSSSNIYGYHFILSDNITGAVLIERHVFPQTNFQFPDPKLFSRHYKFVIAGVNKLGDGISREKIFSIQEVPKSVEGTSVHFIEQDRDNHDNAVYKLTIPIKLECAPKAPLHTNISILCNETDLVYENNSLVEYSFGENLTRVVSVPMHQQCNITIVFSNGAGQSESFILAFDTTTPVASTSTTPSPTQTPSPTKPPPNIGLIIGCVVAAVFLIVTCIVIAIIGYKCRKNCCKKCKK